MIAPFFVSVLLLADFALLGTLECRQAARIFLAVVVLCRTLAAWPPSALGWLGWLMVSALPVVLSLSLLKTAASAQSVEKHPRLGVNASLSLGVVALCACAFLASALAPLVFVSSFTLFCAFFLGLARRHPFFRLLGALLLVEGAMALQPGLKAPVSLWFWLMVSAAELAAVLSAQSLLKEISSEGEERVLKKDFLEKAT